MTIFYRAGITVFLALLPFSSIAQDSSSQAETIHHIIKETSIKEQLSQAVNTMRSQFENNPLGLEASKNELMIDLFGQAFVADSLINKVRDVFEQQYNAEYADSTMKWLKLDITQQVNRAEKEFHTLQGFRKRIVRMYELEQDSPSEERINSIKSLIEFTSAAESAVESNAIIFRSVVSAFSKLSDQQTLSESQIDMVVGNYRNQIQSQIEQEMTNQLLIKYYELENEPIKEYISFYQTKPGNWLSATTSNGIHSALKTAAGRFIESVNSSE